MSVTRGRTKPKMTEAQRWTGRTMATRKQRDGKGSTVSWWTAFAQGDRRDAEFAAEVEGHCPGSITRKQMGPTLTPWVDQ